MTCWNSHVSARRSPVSRHWPPPNSIADRLVAVARKGIVTRSGASLSLTAKAVRRIASIVQHTISPIATTCIAIRNRMYRVSAGSRGEVSGRPRIAPRIIRPRRTLDMWKTIAAAAAACLLCAACQNAAKSGEGSQTPFATPVDEYLGGFARRHPSIAAGNGLHAHDDLLEDFSAPAIAAEIDWLRAMRGRIDAVDTASLSADERVDHRILIGIVDGWLLDLDRV